jgi:ribokinase
MNAPVVVVGSLNADFVFRVPRFLVPGETLVGRSFEVFPGGKGANQAYGAARLGSPVAMIGQVGKDAQGDWLKAHLAGAGVDVTGVLKDETVSSGVAAITINADAQNQIVIIPGANGTLTPDRLKPARAVISSARVVLLQLEIPLPTVEAAARLAKEGGATLILDPAPAEPLPDALLRLADYITPNESELCILAGTTPGALTVTQAAELAHRLIGRGAKKCIVKLGAQGALLVTPELQHFWPAIPVKAIDTTAAGDAFNAAFGAALARGVPELEAGRYATGAAACSVQRPGAQPSMPNDAEVQELLAAGSRASG